MNKNIRQKTKKDKYILLDTITIRQRTTKYIKNKPLNFYYWTKDNFIYVTI